MVHGEPIKFISSKAGRTQTDSLGHSRLTEIYMASTLTSPPSFSSSLSRLVANEPRNYLALKRRPSGQGNWAGGEEDPKTAKPYHADST